MFRDAHNAGAIRPLGTWIVTLLLALTAAASHATIKGDIVVTSASGDARLTHRGAERPARKGAVVLLPSTVRTGRDGAMELAQGGTTLSIGADTVLEFPEGPTRGAPVERIIQSSGNAFYDVAKREGRKLRVETPYLVAVIKGTQFSVAVLDGATSISLIEGQLEILSPDGGSAVDIDAGQIALRRQGDAEISVMSATEPQVRVNPDASGATAALAARTAGDGADATVVTLGTSRTGVELTGRTGDSVDTTGQLLAGGEVGLDVRGLETGGDAVASLDVNADVMTGGAPSVDLGVDAGVVGIDTSVNIGADLGSGNVDVGLGIGNVNVDLGVELGVDLGSVVEDPIGTVGQTVDTGAETLGTIVEDVGGLVSGLPLRSPIP